MIDKPAIDLAVGQALNRLRMERGLTVTSLATRAGVSPAMVSRIEKAQVSPSLATLSALAGALSVPVMALLAEHEQAADIYYVKEGQGLPSRRVTPDHSHDYLLLGKHGGPGGRFDAARIRIEAADAGTLPGYQHEGYAFIHVLSGAATYRCGGEVIPLGPGDSVSFDAKLPHGFAEITGDHIEFLTVTSRPA
ncbi:helix-turn-helix domain-containing protein [Yoonia sediminilitoris]|uniref:XRE family transcriptional regulator n=1 Tax=Yoonia sediminilitoris TaxID=1286148 RepID=A0A2T6KB00_9RHOB|nr:XRE family transcriptional regulator [Yoonia sediminilitoris]PUB12049.1 XRE family transcriptional regulator [Yoonia sediminilitoris]RCW92876.1 XRE family transcriptional regulator [Yoonia sediminilitoris]